MDSSRDIVRKLREGRILNERKDYSSMEKEELVRLAQDGDQLAFETLINQNQDFFYRMTKKYVPEGTFDSDDILQIAEIAYWEAVNKWDGTGDFDAYAGMVIKRRLTDEYRKLQADKVMANRNTVSTQSMEDVDDFEVQGPEATKSEFDSWVSNSHRSAEDDYLDQDTMEHLTQFFRTEMTEIERKLISMYLDGYKMSQIAEETGVNYKSCENAVRRAKNKLKDYFNGMRESKKLREGTESIFSEEESRVLKKILNNIDGDMNESKKMNESAEEHPGWEYFELPKGHKGPWEANQYTKEYENGYLVIYPPQPIPGNLGEDDDLSWHAEVDDGYNMYEYKTGFNSFEEAEAWINEYISKNLKESKEVEEHLEVAPNDSSTTAEKVAYVKKMVEKAKNEGDEHSAWDIVDFLYDSMLLDQIPLSESKKMRAGESKNISSRKVRS